MEQADEKMYKALRDLLEYCYSEERYMVGEADIMKKARNVLQEVAEERRAKIIVRDK